MDRCVMRRIFTFESIAVICRHWFEIDLSDASMEHGARVEVRELAAQPERGTESAAQVISLDRPLWRADLFDRLTDEPGTYGVAHFHPSFHGVEPSARVFEAELTADPWAWLDARLHAWDGPAISSGDAHALAAFAHDIVLAARSCAPERCTSVEHCFEMTRDVQPTVRRMIAALEQPDRLDRDRTALWVGT